MSIEQDDASAPRWIDIGANLTSNQFKRDLGEVIARAEAAATSRLHERHSGQRPLRLALVTPFPLPLSANFTKARVPNLWVSRPASRVVIVH